MNFSNLYTDRLDEELGTDDSTLLFTTARRKHAVNEGLRQFADLTECFTRQSTVSCSHAIAEYDLLSTVNVADADFVRFSKQRPEFQFTDSNGRVQHVSGENFRRTTVEWLNQYEPGWRQSTGGTPQFYYERADQGRRFLGLFPPPEIGSSETAKVLLPYVARPSSMISDTDVAFKNSSLATRHDFESFHESFAHYGAYRLEKLRVNTQASQEQFQVFMGFVQRWISAMRPKGGTTVKMGRSYFGEARKRSGVGGPNPWPTDAWGDR